MVCGNAIVHQVKNQISVHIHLIGSVFSVGLKNLGTHLSKESIVQSVCVCRLIGVFGGTHPNVHFLMLPVECLHLCKVILVICTLRFGSRHIL